MNHVFAISLQDQVEKYGAYIGIAAFFGLAVLTVLYFAQAREMKRLREWAGREPERSQEAAALALARTQAQPSVAVRAVPATSQPAPTVAVPDAAASAEESAPPPAVTAAGAGSTVLAAPVVATGGSDGSDGDHGPPPDESPTEASAPDADGAAPPDVVDTEAADTDPAAAESPQAGSQDGEPEEAVVTPAIGAAVSAESAGPDAPKPSGVNGAADQRMKPSTGVPVPDAKPVPAAPLRVPAGSARPPSQAPGVESAGRRLPPGASSSRTTGRSGRVTAVVLAGVLVTLAALVFVGTQLFGDSEEPPPRANVVAGETSPSDSPTAGAGSARTSVTENRARTQVAVFNGTTTTGLALSMAERLQSRGYPEGAKTGNFTPDPAAPDQLRAKSTVYYAEGQRAQARDVGRLLAVSEFKQIDDDLQSLSPEAKVLVIVGADKTR